MHVVYLHPHFTYPGGAGTFVLETAKRLVNKGVTVTIISQTATSDIQKEFPGIRFEFVGGPLPNTFRYWLQYFVLYKRVERLLDKIQPDLIFPQVFPANYWGFLYKKHNTKIPCVWFCQEPSAFVHDSRVINGLPPLMRFFAKASNPIMKIIDRSLVHSADYIFVNSNYSARRFEEVYGSPKPETVYFGLDITEFPLEPVEKEEYFLTVSRLTKFKNIDLAINSVSLLKQRGIPVKLIIVGDGEEKENLVAQSKQLGLSENVVFAGKISRERLVSYYSKALCVIFPSIDEPFGIVPVEAQAAWTPVIATKSGGPVETIIDGESGFLIKPFSASDELAEKMQFLAKNPLVATSMGKVGRMNIEKRFSWDTACEQLLENFIRFTS